MYKRTILIVDDQIINRKSLGKLLEDEYEILYACDGKEAMVCLKEHSDIISAVLLDIMMPVMNGYDVLQAMQKDSELSKIPVIVSSQRDGDDAEIRALELGAQDFIAKPYKVNIIHHRLENMIKLRETAAVMNKTQKDDLSGLFNKQYFIHKIQKVLIENRDKEYDLLCIGIERFKLINDTYGVFIGDKVLHYLGELLQEACQTNICGRFEADNFYALLPHHEQYTNDMFIPWEQKVNEFPIDMDIKVHCGLYYIQDRYVSVSAMCDRAKLAADKNRGKYDELFYVYDDSIREKLIEENFINSNMKNALEQDQFHVYYQPKYDLNTEKIAGAEALIRWIHPERGFISPGVFIPLFELNGFIWELDQFVWETACRDIRSWLDQGYPPIAVSVNVSRADIYNPKLIETLQNLVHKYDIPIRYLHLEVTESAYTENPKQIISVINTLRKLGFAIEMDDFGSGYSSLNMLAQMSVDVLKLDMGFIQTETKNSSGKGILSFVISLAKWLNLAVVAEGVETKEQVLVLRSMDCNYVQGYYYAKPMDERAFRELIRTTETTEMCCKSIEVTEPIKEQQQKEENTNKRVMLIVDDIEINRAVLATIFSNDYEIVEKENGQVAWEYLENHYEQVGIVMLDLLMPVMDGFHLLKKIRTNANMEKLPVIITSQGENDSEQRALDMHADEFISKPYKAEIIRHRVENVVAAYEYRNLKQKCNSTL